MEKMVGACCSVTGLIVSYFATEALHLGEFTVSGIIASTVIWLVVWFGLWRMIAYYVD